jgi:DNA-binding beta-propeller fold protein YncE
MLVVTLHLTVLFSAAGEYKASFLYTLSDFSGTKPFSSARINQDLVKNEVYAMVGEAVSVFNTSGMEVYRFDYDPTIGIVSDVAVLGNGQLAMLASKGPLTRLVRCNFRGEPLGTIELSGLPAEFSTFSPSRVFARDGKLYQISFSAMQVVISDEQGAFIKGVDLAKELGMSEKEREESGLGGFAIDHDGGFLFTVPATARVFLVSADGKQRVFGKRGSAPGRFGVVTGIAVDKDGNILVVDKLRCVVMIFDRTNFALIKEFGNRGLKPGNLIGPDDILIDKQNRAYVSSLRKRGISVYQLSNY